MAFNTLKYFKSLQKEEQNQPKSALLGKMSMFWGQRESRLAYPYVMNG